ncbi:MAG TPA: redoxin domain-containing protein [Chitinophagaceae bacterium]|nr:redoxin domain-containing protein [Chitinophagaceae bacterium]
MNRFRLYLTASIFSCFAFILFFPSRMNSQTIPPFKMTLSNNKIFNAADLPKGKPLVLIYFDPDCDHCQKLMADLFKKINSFKKVEMVLITFKSVTEVAAFEKKYTTSKYANMKVGTEGTLFYLKIYYKLVKMPFTVLYDSKGNYSYSYRDETPVDDLIKRLQGL